MDMWSFKDHDLLTVSEALEMAEEVTCDFFKFSSLQWKRHRYDVKTLSSLRQQEISLHAFALLHKGVRQTGGLESKARERDYYFICLQDNRILEALGRDKELGLLPLLVYVFTHELVHIVRFCNFLQRFDAGIRHRDREERVVHSITFDILRDVSLKRLDYILDSYENHRFCELPCV
jgi:hypothetical protein